MALGINKDLEPMARLARRQGWDVDITRRNHVRWTSPEGLVLYSGLTMSSGTARNFQRKLAKALEPADVGVRNPRSMSALPG